MDKEKISEIINDLYLFYRVFVASHFAENLPAPHIKKLSRELMRLYEGSDKSYKRLCVAMPPRHPIENECPVLTTKGWKTHGSLEVGDYVFSPNGEPTKVIEVHPKTMVDNCLEFDNGDIIVCGDNHLWKVYDRSNRKYSLLETQELMKRKLKQYATKKHETSTFSIDLVEPLNFPKQKVPIDPYWLGLWLGDGHHKRPSIITHKKDVITTKSTPYEIIRYDEKEGNCIEAIYSHQGLTEKLRELGVYGNKHIPDKYLYNSLDVRMELLAGLIDSDGCVEKERNRLIFSNTNKILLKQVYELLITLGFSVSVSKQTSDEQNNYKKHSKTNYEIDTKKDLYHLRAYSHISIPTKLHRKQLTNKKHRRIGLNKAYKVKPIEGNCITVENENGLYLVGKHLTTTHNSKSSLITLSFPMWAIFHDPNLNILIITNSGALSEKFGIQLREYIDEYGKYFNVFLSDVKKSSSYLMFCDKDKKLYNGSIRLVGKGGSITGTDADILIIDDPYKGLEEEFTPSALDKMNNYYDTIIEQRLEPHSIEIILHTRWNSYDLQGYLKENDSESYKFMELPAISEDGTPLWKERYTLKELEKKRERMGVRMFNAIYQQQPMDTDSDFFDLSKLKTGKPSNAQIIGKCRAWDLAGSTDEKGDANDYTVGVLMELYDDNSVCITDIVRGQYGNNVKEVIKETAFRDGLDTHIIIETGVAGAGKLLYAEYQEQLRGFIVDQALPVKSKEDRATPFRNAMLDGLVYIDVGDEAKKIFKLELSGFPFAIHDDQVDAVSHGFNALCRMDKGITPDIQFIDLF